MYSGLKLHCRFRLWAPTSALQAVSAVAELLVCVPILVFNRKINDEMSLNVHLLLAIDSVPL